MCGCDGADTGKDGAASDGADTGKDGATAANTGGCRFGHGSSAGAGSFAFVLAAGGLATLVLADGFSPTAVVSVGNRFGFRSACSVELLLEG